jgi:RHS repeat-associated protein
MSLRKKTGTGNKIILLVSICAFFSLFQKGNAQGIGHATGAYCVGETNVFYYYGPGNAVTWSVDANGTIISTNGGTSIQIVWNSATSGGYVNCTYFNGSTYGGTSISPIVISSSATPTVSISASTTSICLGSTVTFTATPFNGGSSPGYTWYVDGSIAASGYSNSFSTNSLTNGQSISCQMNSNSPCNSSAVTSNSISVSVNTPQTLNVSVSGTTSVCQGTGTSFTASVSNPVANMVYQWKKNGVSIGSDDPTPSYVLTQHSLANGDVYDCIVSSSACVYPGTSNLLTIATVQPQIFSLSTSIDNISKCQGSTATFTATSSQPNNTFDYQWFMNGIAVPNATGSSFATTVSSVSQLQSVYVTASTNAACVNNSSATGTAQYIPFTVNPVVTPSVSITQSVPAVVGASVSFSANPVAGGTNPSYQWQSDGVDIPGATNSTYTTPFSSGSQFRSVGVVVISNAVCAVGAAISSNTVELVSPFWENRTYVRIHSIQKKGIIDWAGVQLLPVGDKLEATTYLDGIGRPIQDLSRETSLTPTNSWNDLVKLYDYSDLNLVKEYLPYSASNSIGRYKTTASTDQTNFIQGFFGETSSAPTYSQTVFDNSPLGRTTKTILAGSNWGTGVSSAYDFNEDVEKVHIWALDYTNSAIPTTTTDRIYPTGSLYKMMTTDEKGDKVLTYTDFEGRVVLKKVQNHDAGTNIEHPGWISTYYVYDDIGRLRYIITPKAVEWLGDNSWNLSQSVADGLCYKYLYDERGREVVRKQPEVDEQYIIYDKKNRVVLTQTANQRRVNTPSLADDQWNFTLYDELNRDIATGLVSNSYDRQTLQEVVNLLNNGLRPNTVSGGTRVTNSFPWSQSIYPDNPVLGPGINIGNVNPIFNSVTTYDTYSGILNNFNTTYNFFDNNNPAADMSGKTTRTTGLVTSQKSRILDYDNNKTNDKWMISNVYYDEYGRVLQILSDNFKGGTDYQTNQYDFSGKILSTYSDHFIKTGPHYTTISRNVYDKIGRIKERYKSFDGGSHFKELAEFNYDELGQLKFKRIDPTSPTSQMETQNYSYNINGLLTGINKDYALNTDNYSQWQTYFSEYIGYNNSDNLFAAAQYNGNITGVIWRTQGDNTPRKYDYTYDHVGRFTSALFLQKAKPSETSWSNSNMDFSVYTEYEDGNGNLKTLKQMGVMPGSTGVVTMDDLHYSYFDITGASNLKGNKLKQVDDLGNLGSNNGKLGDFGDANSTQDYDYDKEGNLTQDLNKNIQAGGVTYNYLNKPIKIVLTEKSQVEYTYDACGQKLSKKVTQFASTANNNVTTVTTTDYVGDYVYQTIQSSPLNADKDYTNKLLFILHEEGRLKMIKPAVRYAGQTVSNDLSAGTDGVAFSSTQYGVFEFFIKDHLGNNRMVLTEEVQREYYTATMEYSARDVEDGVFGKVTADGTADATNELEATRIVNSDPATAAWPNHPNDFVKLTGSDPTRMVGPNMLLKVMAGDMITTSARYYYMNNNSTSGSTDPAMSIPAAIYNALTSPGKTSSVGKTYAGNIQLNLQSAMFNFLKNTEPSNGVTNAPKAYINIVFMDEQFRFIDKDDNDPGVGTDFTRVSAANDPDAYLPLKAQKAPKNGWVFVYLSNESVEPVYFDDFTVQQVHSRIAEETHFYPHGLKIAGISSQAFNKLDSKYGYQGVFSEEEDETGWNEFELRNYDPQIGRWLSVDPADQFSSPYLAMGNNPISVYDKDGAWSFGLTGAVVGTIAGSVAANLIIQNNPQMNGALKIALQIGLPILGAGMGYSLFESLNNGAFHNSFGGGTNWNDNDNLGDNFRAFYAPLLGEDGARNSHGRNVAWSPDYTIKLPKVDIKFVKVLPFWKLWNAPSNGKPGYSAFGLLYRFVLNWIGIFGIPYFGSPYVLYNYVIREIIRIPKIRIQ